VARDIGEAPRTAVVQRAGSRCEYCLIQEEDAGFPLQVDHIMSRKHGGLSVEDNLACACVLCNRHKGTDISGVNSETGKLVRLFHPRQQRWGDHFRLRGAVIVVNSWMPVGSFSATVIGQPVWSLDRDRQLVRPGAVDA
jgi:hypothetical protein